MIMCIVGSSDHRTSGLLVEPFQVSLIELDLDETYLITNLHDVLNNHNKDDYISPVFMHGLGIIRG